MRRGTSITALFVVLCFLSNVPVGHLETALSEKISETQTFCSTLGNPSSGRGLKEKAVEPKLIPEPIAKVNPKFFAASPSSSSIKSHRPLLSKLTSKDSDSDYDCSVLSDNTVEIDGYTGQETILIVPDTLGGYPVTRVGDYAFSENDTLEAVYLPLGVTYIGEDAFEGCAGLLIVSVSPNLTYIDDEAFCGCSSLASLNITSTRMDYIGREAFCGCSSLASFHIPSGISSIKSGTFLGCSSLDNLVIPESVIAIENDWLSYTGAFSDCSSLKSITLPSSLKSIGTSTFSGCSALSSIELPSSITNIGDGAFSGCSGLVSVTIPYGVTSIKANTFEDCSSLASIDIPDSVTEIEEYAFYGCSSLVSIILPRILMIAQHTFDNCAKLANVTIPYGVTDIDYRAFDNCENLKEIVLPYSITSIGSYAFSNLLKICGYAGTYAATYAMLRSIEFEPLDFIYIDSIAIEPSLTLMKAEKANLNAVITPSNATIPAVKWSSSDPSVAAVSSSGVVIGGSKGTATITATARDEHLKSAHCDVTVKQNVTNITLDRTEMTLNVGEATNLSAIVTPENANNKDLLWSSNNEDVVAVDVFGRVAALKPGTAVVTASASDGSNVSTRCTVHVIQSVTGITLSLSKIMIEVGQVVSSVTTTIVPANASNKTVKWASSNVSVAAVDTKGTITGIKSGTAIITASAADDSNKSASIPVHVVEKGKSVTGITLNKSSATAVQARTISLTAKVTPSSATDKTIQWRSSDTSIASVSQKGIVTGVRTGETTITAIASSGIKTTCAISVIDVPVSGVGINKSKATVLLGAIYQLIATVYPSDAKDKTLVWASDALSVASVDQNGLVTANAIGTATISATSGNNKTAKCKLTVNPVLVSKITLNAVMQNLYIGEGDSAEKTVLMATVVPANATNARLSWSSSNRKVATVDQDGIAMAVGTGTTTITAKATDGSKKAATCVVKVSIHVNEIQITGNDSLAGGKSTTLKVSILPKNATNKSVAWRSSDTSIATVNSSGKVTTQRTSTVQTVTISASSKDGSNLVAQQTITITPVVTKIVLTEATHIIYLSSGNPTFHLTAACQPSLSNQAVVWSSSNKKLATIDKEGNVTAHAKGVVIISALASDGSGKKATCKVWILR